MTPSLFIEMHSGVSGDMLVAALMGLCDAPLRDRLLAELSSLFQNKENIQMDVRQKSVSGISAHQIHFNVSQEADWGRPATEPTGHSHSHGPHSHSHEHSHPTSRTFKVIKGILENSTLEESIKAQSIRVFETLAKAEGAVHGQFYEEVHFHEVGSMDAICDVVSVCFLIHHLGVQRIYATPFLLGSGSVVCAHGLMPVPVPAVVKMLEQTGCPSVFVGEETGELTTPTGCALVASLGTEFCSPKGGVVKKVSYGAGQKTLPGRPNFLRLTLLEEFLPGVGASKNLLQDDVVEIKTNIDDMTPEDLSVFVQSALEEGALDVWTTAVASKKWRHAFLLTLLCRPEDRGKLGTFLLERTSAIGYRHTLYHREKLPREERKYQLDGETLSLKIVNLPSGNKRWKVESRCRIALSEKWNVPLWEVDKRIASFLHGITQEKV